MKTDDLNLAYISILEERMKECNKKSHHNINFFFYIAIVSYLVYALSITELSFLGITAKIPRTYIVGIAPFILTYFFYSFNNLASVEAECEIEFKNSWKKLENGTDYHLNDWQFELIEIPQYYSYEGLLSKNSSRFFSIGGIIIQLMIFILNFLMPLATIGFFIFTGWMIIKSPILLILHGFSIFIGIFSLARTLHQIKRDL